MKKHNTTSPPRLAALMIGAALLGLVSQSALALGTPAGTPITNTASLAYKVGTVVQTPIDSNTTSFVVDNKVNLTVAKVSDLATLVPGSTKKALAFTVTNNGNKSQSYKLTAVAGAATIDTMTNVLIYNDVNGDGIWDAGDTAYVDGAATVLADGFLKILIIADAPIGATNGQTAVYNLQAQTTDAGTTTVTANASAAADLPDTVQVVWADIALGSVGDSAPVPDGKHSASATYTIATSALTVAKTVTLLCDPVNGTTNPKNIPGAVVQYAITISNAPGAASATLTSLSDALAASLAWEPKLISGASTPANASTNCVSGFAGTAQSATTGFGVIGATGTTASGYLVPGLATQATTAGATATVGAGGTVSINYATLTAGIGIIPAGLAAGAMPANSAITVYFNAVVQ